MELRYDPLPVIFDHGDITTKLACLTFFSYKETPKAMEYLQILAREQHPDGTFPSSIDPEHWGMVETVRKTITLLMGSLSFPNENITKAMRFILNHQMPDGGWTENPDLAIPEDRLELSNQHSVTWLTADIIELMIRLDMVKHDQYKKAVDWLKSKQNEYGGWYCYTGDIGEQRDERGDPDATAQIAFLFKEISGENDPIFRRGRELFEHYLYCLVQDIERGYRIRFRDGKTEKLDVYHLTHLLLSSFVDAPRRFESGYDMRDARVQKMMESLVAMQFEDGGWQPSWIKETSAMYTLLALKVLILSGAVVKETVEIDVDKYTR